MIILLKFHCSIVSRISFTLHLVPRAIIYNCPSTPICINFTHISLMIHSSKLALAVLIRMEAERTYESRIHPLRILCRQVTVSEAVGLISVHGAPPLVAAPAARYRHKWRRTVLQSALVAPSAQAAPNYGASTRHRARQHRARRILHPPSATRSSLR